VADAGGGVVYPFAPFAPRETAAQIVGPLLVATDHQVFGGFGADGTRRPVVDWMPELDPELGPPVTGDHDMFNIRFPDGSRLSFEKPPPGTDGVQPEVWSGVDGGSWTLVDRGGGRCGGRRDRHAVGLRGRGSRTEGGTAGRDRHDTGLCNVGQSGPDGRSGRGASCARGG
jgi:hypothetical protein